MPHVVERRIGLVLRADLHYSAGLLTGVYRYALAANWQVHFQTTESADASLWKSRGCEGFIVHIADEATARFIDLGVPVINVSTVRALSLPSVVPDNRAIGTLAAEHLLRRPLSNFAFLAQPERSFAIERGRAFQKRLQERGYGAHWFEGETITPVMQWLAKLPKPVGLFCSSDYIATVAIHASQAARLAVGESVAIIGVDNDPHIVLIANPPLTSIDLDTERIGYDAAAMLAAILSGESAGRTQFVPPKQVIVRQSCQVGSFHPDLIEAQRYIERFIDRPLTIDEIVAHVASTRRTLERHFRASLGCSIRDSIVHMKINQVKDLLVNSDLPIQEIARRFSMTPTRLGILFREVTGTSPRAFRAQRQS